MKKFFLSFFSLYMLWSGVGFCADRIVSLGPYCTENLLLLGLDKELKGITVHDREFLRKGRETIGTLLEPNIEKILSLQPDMVIASKEGNREGNVQKLRSLGIKVVILEEVRSLKASQENFLFLAKETGREEVAKKVLSALAVRMRTPISKGRKSVFIQLGIRPIFTAGKYSYFDEIIERAGGKNLFHRSLRKYFAVSQEEVVRRNPDIILTLDMGLKEEISSFWSRFPNMGAVKFGKIVSVDDMIFSNPTPLHFCKAIEIVRSLLEEKE